MAGLRVDGCEAMQTGEVNAGMLSASSWAALAPLA